MNQSQDNLGDVYLLHFSKPYKHAKHYLGFCRSEEVARRLQEHASGKGSNLCTVAAQAGVTFTVARVWLGVTRTYERSLKNQGGASRICPICREEARQYQLNGRPDCV